MQNLPTTPSPKVLADRLAEPTNRLDSAGRMAGLPGVDTPVDNSAGRMFNVLLTRKARKKNMESHYLTIVVPDGEDEHVHIRTYVRTNHFGWAIAGYAPRTVKPFEGASGET